MSHTPITELVELRLLAPFSEFLPFFETEQLPVLLHAPGIISVRTGPKITLSVPKRDSRRNSEQEGPAAVSITQWESLESHQAFLRSEPAKAFFERMDKWLAGPPEISHYALGDLRGLNSRGFVGVRKVGMGDDSGDNNERGVVGKYEGEACVVRRGKGIEDRSGAIEMVFSQDLGKLESVGIGRSVAAGSDDEAFGVQVRSFGVAVRKARL